VVGGKDDVVVKTEGDGVFLFCTMTLFQLPKNNDNLLESRQQQNNNFCIFCSKSYFFVPEAREHVSKRRNDNFKILLSRLPEIIIQRILLRRLLGFLLRCFSFRPVWLLANFH
jgi:hypothetical protein